MDLTYLQIECEHSFSKLLASQQSDKTALDVTLEYFESKLESALTFLDTSEIYEVYLLHSDVTIAHPLLGHDYDYSSILEYETSPSGIKEKLIEDWFNAGSKNNKSSPAILVIAAMDNQKEVKLFEKLIPSTDELMGNVSVILFREDKHWSMSQYDKTAEKFEGLVSGDTSCLFPLSNIKVENLDRSIKFLGLLQQKSCFFMDYLVELGGTRSSSANAYDDNGNHGESGEGAMKKNDALDQEKNHDGISTPLGGLDDEVWDRGYYCETDDGIWYEVYANENIKGIWGDFELEDPEEKEMFEGFSDFNVSMFGDYGQITFFVAKGDEENTLDALTEIFI